MTTVIGPSTGTVNETQEVTMASPSTTSGARCRQANEAARAIPASSDTVSETGVTRIGSSSRLIPSRVVSSQTPTTNAIASRRSPCRRSTARASTPEG